MRAARGEYIAFLDQDAYWMPEHLESLCAVLNSRKADLAYSDCCVFREMPSGEIELFPIETFEVKNPPKDLFRRNFISPSCAAITRQLMEKVGDFDQALWLVQDLDYWIHAAALGFEIASTGEQTYYYRKSAGSLSAVPARMAECNGRIFERRSRCGILPESDIVARARATYVAAGKLYRRENPPLRAACFISRGR
jgi:GT2 family glycosyltransferase